MAKREKKDWEAIKREYCAGQLSNVQIGKMYNVSEGAIRKKAKKLGWTQDLSARVRARIRAKLAHIEVKDPDVNEDEVIESASDRGKEIIVLHRKDINSLRELETNLIKELKENPTKLYITQYRGQIIEKIVGLTAAERALAANNLANVMHKRIALERQAFNLDEPAKDGEIKLKVVYDDKASPNAT